MGNDDTDHGSPTRRDFLRAGGAGAVTAALAGCGGTSDEEADGGPSTSGSGTTGDGDGTATDTETEETGDEETGEDGDERLVASVAAVDTEFTAEESDLVASTFATESYARLAGDLPGVEPPPDTMAVGHQVRYGHRAGREADGAEGSVPTLRRLSAGTLTLPTLGEGGENAFAELELAEVVAREEGNLFLEAAGLGRSVAWLAGPVPVGRSEAAFLDTTGAVETFVGVVRARPGAGLADGADAGFLDDAEPGAYLTAVHAARATVGGGAAMVGMVEGWRRPPTMGPGEEEIDPDLAERLGEAYADAARAALFRRTLGRSGLVAGSTIPDPAERPPPPERETRRESYSTRWGLHAEDQVELGYPEQTTHDTTLRTVFTVGRDVPSLASGETYDEDEHSRGTEYTVEVAARAAAYPLSGDDTLPFGVISSEPIWVEYDQRNPLLTGSLEELLTGAGVVRDLLGWTGEYADVTWDSGPTEVDQVSGLELRYVPATVKIFEGTVTTVAPDGETATRDVTVTVGRVQLTGGVIVPIAVQTGGGDGYFDRDAALQRLFEAAFGRLDRDPTTPDEWVDGSLTDLNLVQICRDTRLETPSADVLTQPDPDLVEGRNTAPPFDLTLFDGTVHAGKELEYGVVTFDVANRSGAPLETIMSGGSIADIDTESVPAEVVLDRATHDDDPANDLPVFQLQDSDDAVTTRFHAPSGYTYDGRTVSEGSDYTTTEMDVLRVGFITVVDPEGGSTYGDGNGRPVDYPRTVDSAVEYLKRTFPTGLAVYRHDGAIEGVTNVFGNVGANATVDYENARVALERIADPNNDDWTYSGETTSHGVSESDARSQIRSNGFDVWVLIVPNGYYQFYYEDGQPAGLAPWNDDMAVTAVEADREGPANAASTVAQEIGHRLQNKPYREPTSGNGEDNPLAQRDDDGAEIFTNRDLDHARHLNSKENPDTPTDEPGVVSRAYSLAEGEFVVPSFHTWDAGQGSWVVRPISKHTHPYGEFGPIQEKRRLGRVESYISYSGYDLWTDSVVTQHVIDGDLNREAGTLRTFKIGGVTEVDVGSDDSFLGDGEEGNSADDPTTETRTATLADVEVYEDYPTETQPFRLEQADSVATVTVSGPDGDVFASTEVPMGTGVYGHDVDDTRIEDVAVFDVELPDRAVDVRLDHEEGGVRFNPITRPLRDATKRLPEGAFAAGAEFDPGRFDDRLAAVGAAMAERRFGEARSVLATAYDDQLAGAIDPEFDPLANQPDQARLDALVEELLGRLANLAESAGGGDG
jgi:hypothetical protein